MKVIVLAGGAGSRLWPLSRLDFPKQFLSFQGNDSLLQKTLKRFEFYPLLEEIFVITQADYVPFVEKQLSQIGYQEKVQILVEPYRKGTGPAIALTIKYLQEKFQEDSDSQILIVPSDHLMAPEETFLKILEQIERSKPKKIVTFGIVPDRPETGFGYIQLGKSESKQLFHAEQFIEKPSEEKAKELISSGNYLWNCGIFLFSLKTFWKELQKFAPEIFQKSQGSYLEMFSRFVSMPNISIDHALMEKTKNLSVCPLDLTWSDVGSWDSVYELLEKDSNFNVKQGNVLDIETKNSLILSDKRLISTIGLEDMLIVETEDALFLSKKGKSQQVKTLVSLLEKGQTEKKLSQEKSFSWGTSKNLVEESLFSITKKHIFPLQQTPNFYSQKECIRLIVLKGFLTLFSKEKSISLKSGETFLLQVGEEFSLKNEGTEEAEFLEIKV